MNGTQFIRFDGIEKGKRNPSPKNIAAIAEALDVTLSELFPLERTSGQFTVGI